jgi:hypothetical protein
MARTHAQLKMTKSKANANHVDKRTGIVYTNVVTTDEKREPKMQPHLDAFIPATFLKSYFSTTT